MSVNVKNINGTANRIPPDGSSSWKEYWEKYTNRSFSTCSNLSCNNHAILGGHVMKVNFERTWYITPLCSGCNMKSDSFYVNESSLVPAR